MKLYEINASIQSLLDNAVDAETGELLPDALEGLDALTVQREEKLEHIALYIKNLDGDVAKLKAEEDNLRKRRAAAEKRTEWLRVYLEANFEDTETLKTSRVIVKWRNNPISVTIADEAATRDWLRENGKTDCLDFPPPKIRKAGVKALLNAGEEIPGAALERRRVLNIK